MTTYWGVELQFHHSWPGHWMEMSGQLHDPAALPSEEPQVLIEDEIGRVPEQVWML
jgi:hypothetical protein